MKKPPIANLTDEESQKVRHFADAFAAIRAWEERRLRVIKARATHEESGTQRDLNRYQLELDALKADRNYAIGTLCLVGKKLTVDGFRYTAIPSRREIRVMPLNRPAAKKGTP